MWLKPGREPSGSFVGTNATGTVARLFRDRVGLAIRLGSFVGANSKATGVSCKRRVRGV